MDSRGQSATEAASQNYFPDVEHEAHCSIHVRRQKFAAPGISKVVEVTVKSGLHRRIGGTAVWWDMRKILIGPYLTASIT